VDIETVVKINEKIKTKGYRISLSNNDGKITFFKKNKKLAEISINKYEYNAKTEFLWEPKVIKNIKKKYWFQWKKIFVEMIEIMDELYSQTNPYKIRHELCFKFGTENPLFKKLLRIQKKKELLKKYEIANYIGRIILERTFLNQAYLFEEKKTLIKEILREEMEKREGFYDHVPHHFQSYFIENLYKGEVRFFETFDFYYIGRVDSFQMNYREGEITLSFVNDKKDITTLEKSEIQKWINHYLDHIYRTQRMENLYEKPRYITMNFLTPRMNELHSESVFRYLSKKHKNKDVDEIFIKSQIYYHEIKKYEDFSLIQLMDLFFVLDEKGAKGFENHEIEKAKEYYLNKIFGRLENEVDEAILSL
jgi:hypothetical protein